MAKKVAQKSGRDIFLTRKVTPICKGAPRNFGRSEEGLFVFKKKTSTHFFSRNVIGDLGVPKKGVGTNWENSWVFFWGQERDGRFGVFFGGPPK